MSTSLTLASGSWWKAALIRAVRTAIYVAVPYFGAVLVSDVPWVTIGSTAALAFILSLVTSLFGLAENDPTKNPPWWYAAGERTLKTFLQGVIAGTVGAVLITDVNWAVVLQTSAIAALGSLLTAFLTTLPEAADPVAVPIGADGVFNITNLQAAPPVPAVTSPATSPATDPATDYEPRHAEGVGD